ncbi:MAG: sirtuin [Spirochaeta sp. LUC14_002_19_P3]|nr:MAG: sirtuin [Spirochaeta sp. LUC14_002_19_P3]
MMETLYITGAGVSAESGIPTFRGTDGFWTIGSINYTPQEIATRAMYLRHPDEFLHWYFKRFATYHEIKPNSVHYWLADKTLITQNIDGLDGKAGNKNYIPIHGRLDKVSLFLEQGIDTPLLDAPWPQVFTACQNTSDANFIKKTLLDAFKISAKTKTPELGVSLKPFVLLFDEYYTENYRISEAERWMGEADHFVFMGTSFSVNITTIALRIALSRQSRIEVVDPNPIDIGIPGLIHHRITAAEYIAV